MSEIRLNCYYLPSCSGPGGTRNPALTIGGTPYIKINGWNLWPLSSHSKIAPESGMQLYYNCSKLVRKIPLQKNEDSTDCRVR